MTKKQSLKNRVKWLEHRQESLIVDRCRESDKLMSEWYKQKRPKTCEEVLLLYVQNPKRLDIVVTQDFMADMIVRLLRLESE